MSRHLFWLLPGLLFAATGCTEDEDTGSTVPASEGAVQPEGDGTPAGVEDACRWLLEAVERVHTRRGGCDDAERTCPDFILPAGGDATCTIFDAGSVKACVEIIDDYATCDDFTSRPCIVTALDVSCGAEGAGGAAGAGGAEGVVAAPATAGQGGA